MKSKIVVGLTGGFGVGKSSVAQRFKNMGAEVIDADEIAHVAMKKGSPVFDPIIELFEEALHPGGKKMDREKIAEIVFADPQKRKELEIIIHPYVYKKIHERIEASDRPVILVEVPLLFEVGFETLCDKVVVVTCNATVKMKRLKKKKFTEQEVRARERAQMPEALKAQKADFIIDNSKSIYQTQREVERLWYKFVSLSKKKALVPMPSN
ncbi:MAG: dephospho-CoA kinase [Omnitrophica bacterium RIFOXYB12_FULL_50_7]|nr:MAG: dephospho-CoA kinase [Omnitrophica bacterium RIFOXYB12_FULL_50_7]